MWQQDDTTRTLFTDDWYLLGFSGWSCVVDKVKNMWSYLGFPHSNSMLAMTVKLTTSWARNVMWLMRSTSFISRGFSKWWCYRWLVFLTVKNTVAFFPLLVVVFFSRLLFRYLYMAFCCCVPIHPVFSWTVSWSILLHTNYILLSYLKEWSCIKL